jgi:hypothetical protein
MALKTTSGGASITMFFVTSSVSFVVDINQYYDNRVFKHLSIYLSHKKRYVHATTETF